MNCLTVDGLAKTYHGHWLQPTTALVDVTFSVERGETVGLLGSNGAGKTTAFRVVTGLIHATRGRIELFGKHPKEPAARARLGYLPENPRFHEFLTGEEYVDLAARLSGLGSAERRRRVSDVLDQVGLGAARRRRIRTYSKGMQQRVGIAQAIIGRPALYILDEPMTGLDPVGRREVRELIRSLRDEETGVIFSSHVLSDVELTCDRIVMLAGGRVVRDDRLDDLLRDVGTPVEVTFEGIAESALGELLAQLEAGDIDAEPVGSHGERTACLAAGPEAAEALRTAVVERGGTVVSWVPRTPTLEDVFVEEVTKEERP